MINKLRALAGSIRENRIEIVLYLFLSFGLPFVAWQYVDYRLAITVFILTQITLLVLYLRLSGDN